jgi:UDP-glucose:(heptosyl)LPS alpha-1,3-glucosyltransferase
VIHNGVDAVRFNPQRRHNEGKNLRKALGIPEDAKVVLFVGTGFRRKGLGRILRLWERQELPGVRLLVVGNDSRLARYRRRWNQNGSVIFAGPQKQVENYYACADLLVLPAVQEAFGNVVLEAMASGLPVVASAEVGAMNDMSGPLSEGIVADPDDPVELKAKILTMLDHKRWPLFACAARQRAEQFTWDKYFDRLERLLSDCRRQGTISPVPSRPNA